jgi:hypothetical protein
MRARFTITTLRQSNNPPLKKSEPTETEKGEKGEQQSQEHVVHFFYIKGIVHKKFILAGQ